MHRSAVLALLALVGAACSSGDGALSTGRTTLPADGLPIEVAVPHVSDAVPTDTTEPRKPPDATPDPNSARLSIDEALLADVDIGPPWEAMNRDVDRRGYDMGPNQTDCDAYWDLEQLGALGGGSAGWWRDGANLNHDVHRGAASGEDIGGSVVARLLASCSQVRWLEGGSFRIEKLPVAVDGAAAVSLIDEHGETTWLAVLSRADLISVVRVVRWPDANGELADVSVDDFAHIVRLASDRLAAAGPLRDPGAATPATTPAIIPEPTVPTVPTVPDVVDEADQALRDLLVDVADVAAVRPDRAWENDGVQAFTNMEREDESTCAAMISVNRISDALRWTSSISDDVGDVSIQQGIGIAEDADAAIEMVLGFAGVDACDPSDLELPEGAVVTSESLDVPGASAASRLVWEVDPPDLYRESVELFTIAVDGHVMIIGVGWDPSQERPVGLADELAQVAVAKVRAAIG
jgi:hypothetical protein